MRPSEQLLTFLAADEGPTDPVRIQKGLFIYTQRVKEGQVPPERELFNFEPANFGPCDMAIYDTLRHLVRAGLVAELPVEGETWCRYKVTDQGRQAAQAISAEANPNSTAFLRIVREWCDKQTFTSLLRSVYHTWPEFATRSVLPHLRPTK